MALTVLIIGITFCISFAVPFISKYNECRHDFTYQLWDNAYPVKMFENGLFQPTCGFDKIEQITANNQRIEAVPSIIGNCTNLKVLEVQNNNITHLPCSLLEMVNVQKADFTGNDVAKLLEVKGCTLRNNIFPTKFVCKFLSAELTILRFPNQTAVLAINKCIGKFNKLRELVFPYNTNIRSNGIPHEVLILYRNGFTNFDINGNINLLESFSWKNQNIPLYLHTNMTNFLVQYFSGVTILDLSGNNIHDNKVFYTLLNRMTSLEHLDMSKNDFKKIEPRNINESRQLSLKSIDFSENLLSTYLSITFAQFVEARNIYVNLNNNTNMVSLVWDGNSKSKNAVSDKQNYDGSALFPRSFIKTLTHLQAFSIEDYGAIEITSIDLDIICSLPKLKLIKLFRVAVNILYLPDSCGENLEYITILKTGYDPAKSSYVWPQSWLSSKTLKILYIDLPYGTWLPFTPSSPVQSVQTVGNGSFFIPFPNWIFDNELKEFQRFRLNGARFSTSFSTILTSNTSNLISVDLEKNALNGTIPGSLFNMPCLRILVLSGNDFIGHLPHVGKERMSKIRCLDITGNNKLQPLQSDAYFYVEGIFEFPRTLYNISRLCTKLKNTIDFSNGDIYQCGSMNCYDKNPNVICISVKYQLFKQGAQVRELQQNLCNFEIVQLLTPNAVEQCADPNYREEYPLEIYLA
jgi:hypothetical protein